MIERQRGEMAAMSEELQQLRTGEALVALQTKAQALEQQVGTGQGPPESRLM